MAVKIRRDAGKLLQERKDEPPNEEEAVEGTQRRGDEQCAGDCVGGGKF